MIVTLRWRKYEYEDSLLNRDNHKNKADLKRTSSRMTLKSEDYLKTEDEKIMIRIKATLQ